VAGSRWIGSRPRGHVGRRRQRTPRTGRGDLLVELRGDVGGHPVAPRPIDLGEPLGFRGAPLALEPGSLRHDCGLGARRWNRSPGIVGKAGVNGAAGRGDPVEVARDGDDAGIGARPPARAAAVGRLGVDRRGTPRRLARTAVAGDVPFEAATERTGSNPRTTLRGISRPISDSIARS
jgi:hypothetical protein